MTIGGPVGVELVSPFSSVENTTKPMSKVEKAKNPINPIIRKRMFLSNLYQLSNNFQHYRLAKRVITNIPGMITITRPAIIIIKNIGQVPDPVLEFESLDLSTIDSSHAVTLRNAQITIMIIRYTLFIRYRLRTSIKNTSKFLYKHVHNG